MSGNITLKKHREHNNNMFSSEKENMEWLFVWKKCQKLTMRNEIHDIFTISRKKDEFIDLWLSHVSKRMWEKCYVASFISLRISVRFTGDNNRDREMKRKKRWRRSHCIFILFVCDSSTHSHNTRIILSRQCCLPLSMVDTFMFGFTPFSSVRC